MNQGWDFPWGLIDDSNHPGWIYSATNQSFNWTNLDVWADYNVDPPYYTGDTITDDFYRLALFPTYSDFWLGQQAVICKRLLCMQGDGLINGSASKSSTSTSMELNMVINIERERHHPRWYFYDTSGTGYADLRKGLNEAINVFSVTNPLTQNAANVFFTPSQATTGDDYYLSIPISGWKGAAM